MSTPRWVRRPGRYEPPSLRLLIIATTLAAGCSTQQLGSLGDIATRQNLEAVGRVVEQALPIGPEREREIGFGIAATVAGRYDLVEDPELIRYLTLVGQSVAQQSVRVREVSFHFGLLDTDDVNAFAAPGGYVFLTRGALSLMESEAELAAVLAHEVGHVDQKHVLEEIRRSSVFMQARDEAELEGEFLDRVADVGSTLLFTGLSREDEMDADSLGLVYAAATGYRADGLLQFLGHLKSAESSPGGAMREWLATHPSTDERIAAVERQLRGTGATSGAAGRERFRQFVGDEREQDR